MKSLLTNSNSYSLFLMAVADYLAAFGLSFAGMALAVNCYQEQRILQILDLILEEEKLIGKHIKELHTHTKTLEALASKLEANCTKNLKALLAKLGAKEV
ncbi:hypothetical protein ACJW30_02G014400 [Castanea mollissima]